MALGLLNLTYLDMKQNSELQKNMESLLSNIKT
jgi:hypothetical protein